MQHQSMFEYSTITHYSTVCMTYRTTHKFVVRFLVPPIYHLCRRVVDDIVVAVAHHLVNHCLGTKQQLSYSNSNHERIYATVFTICTLQSI